MKIVFVLSGLVGMLLSFWPSSSSYGQNLEQIQKGWDLLIADARQGVYRIRMEKDVGRQIKKEYEILLKRDGVLAVVENKQKNTLDAVLHDGIVQMGFSKNTPPLFFLSGEILPYPSVIIRPGPNTDFSISGQDDPKLKDKNFMGNNRLVDIEVWSHIPETICRWRKVEQYINTKISLGADGNLSVDYEIPSNECDWGIGAKGKINVDPVNNFRICFIEEYLQNKSAVTRYQFDYDDETNGFSRKTTMESIDQDGERKIVYSETVFVEQVSKRADPAVFHLAHYGISPQKRSHWLRFWPIGFAIVVGVVAYVFISKRN